MSRIEEAIALVVKLNDLNHNLARGKAGGLTRRLNKNVWPWKNGFAMLIRSRNLCKACRDFVGVYPKYTFAL